MRPFVDVGDGKLRTNSRQFNPVMWGSDPFTIKIGDRYWIFKTYGPTLPPWPGGQRRGSPGTYAFSRSELGLGDDAGELWNFEGVVLRPWGSSPIKPEGFFDTEGVETFTAVQIGPHLVGMYHGYNSTIRRPQTINHCYLAHAVAEDPKRWTKIQPVISEEQAKVADPRLTLVTAVGEPSLQWDPEDEICIGTMGIKGYHGSDTPPSMTNPFGGKAGHCWRTHLIASRDFVNWWISPPIIIAPGSFQSTQTERGANQTSHSACVLDPREPRLLHVFTTWGGNWGDHKPHPHNPKGLRHWVAPLDDVFRVATEPGDVFVPNPDGVQAPGAELLFNCIRPSNWQNPTSEDAGHIGGPAPLLEFMGDDHAEPYRWAMVYHAENQWRAENGTEEEKRAIAALETRGRRHTRLAFAP